MKKRIRQLLALLLTLSLCLTACGDKEEQTVTTLADELGYGYVSEYSELDVDISWVNSVSSAKGMLYFTGNYYDEETYTSSTKLYQVDPSTGTAAEIPMPALENNENVSEYVQQLTVCPDGSGYWMIYERYVYGALETTEALPEAEAVPEEEAEGDGMFEESAVEEPDEAGLSAEYQVELLTAAVPAVEMTAVEAESEETAVEEVYTEPQVQDIALKVDMSGKELARIDLTEAIKEMQYFYAQATAQDGQGNLYIATDDAILIFGADGTQKESIELEDQWVQDMVATGNGTVMVSYYDSERMGTVLCRLEDGKLSEPLEMADVSDAGSMMLYPGDGDTVLLNDSNILFSVDVNTGSTSKLLSWLDSDINGSSLSGVAATDADTLVVMVTDYGTTVSYELGILTKTPVEELPERTLLTLGAVYLDDVLRKAVINFNRTNDTYRITLVDYSVYNTTEDYSLGTVQLERDVISGNCPDIISLATGSEDKFIAKGALTDLSAMIDKDESFSMEDLVSGPLQAYTVDGKLYGMPVSFSLETLLASQKLVGEIDSWSMEEMAEIIKALPEDVWAMKYYGQETFVTQMTYMNMEQFVDYGTGTCRFDSPEFKLLLEAAACMISEDEMNAIQEAQSEAIENGTYVYVDEYQLVQNGEVLMAAQWMSGSYSVKYLYGLYNQENGFVHVGFPQENGNGVRINVDNCIAIAAGCQQQEGAWAFVKSLLGEKVQSEVWSFPVSVAAFDQVMEEAMERSYYMDGDEKVYYDDYGWIGDVEYPMAALTEEQVEDFKALVNGASKSGTYDTEIMSIIQEEVGAYFAGDKTPEAVMALIQNRVTIYLGETG